MDDFDVEIFKHHTYPLTSSYEVILIRYIESVPFIFSRAITMDFVIFYLIEKKLYRHLNIQI